MSYILKIGRDHKGLLIIPMPDEVERFLTGLPFSSCRSDLELTWLLSLEGFRLTFCGDPKAPVRIIVLSPLDLQTDLPRQVTHHGRFCTAMKMLGFIIANFMSFSAR